MRPAGGACLADPTRDHSREGGTPSPRRRGTTSDERQAERPHRDALPARSATQFFDRVLRLDRRDFLKVAGIVAATAAPPPAGSCPHSFQPVDVVARGRARTKSFRFAYISDSHLYEQQAQRSLRALAPEGGRRRQRASTRSRTSSSTAATSRSSGSREELELGAQILKSAEGAGAHDGRRARLVPRHGREVARAVRRSDTYSFDHKGVHFVVLKSVIEKDFWTAREADARWSACRPSPGSTTACRAASRWARRSASG